ncbi:MAG: hypothetical protein NC548_10985 [Lachnospiraceae bacterium]|nr:hypothetical protein [Lachnospiraceae bacterium]
MKKRYTISAAIAIAVPLVAITVLFVLKGNIHEERITLSNTFEEQLASINEEEPEVEYVYEEPYKFIDVELSRENVFSVISQVDLNADALDTVATLFELLGEGLTYPWSIDYLRNQHDVFELSFDGSEYKITADCFNDECVVAFKLNTGMYYYAKGDTVLSLSDNTVEAMQYLINKSGSNNITMAEAACITGILQTKYPLVAYDVIDGDVYLENGVTVSLHNGALKFMDGDDTGDLLALQTHISGSPVIAAVGDENWRPAETLNIVAIIELLEELELNVPEDSLVALFSKDLPELLQSWTYKLNDTILIVSTVEFDDNADTGLHTIDLFMVDTESGNYSVFY